MDSEGEEREAMEGAVGRKRSELLPMSEDLMLLPITWRYSKKFPLSLPLFPLPPALSQIVVAWL